MAKFPHVLLTGFTLIAGITATPTLLTAEGTTKTISTQPFTGKITKNKVRLRSGATLDAPIIKELNKGDLIVVVGENDDFYAIQTPSDVKGYIFRTFVLDNKIEGNRVNVRVSPNTEAAVIAQMNSGDSVDGTVSPLNNKWLEITPPASTRFFIAKEFVEKVGDQHYLSQMNKRRDEVNRLLQTTYATSQQELQKPYPEIQAKNIVTSYEKVTREYTDFPDQAARAKELLDQFQETYLHKKIAYLEAKAAQTPTQVYTVQQTRQLTPLDPVGLPNYSAPVPDHQTRLSQWEPVEQALYQQWSETRPGSIEEYYAEGRQNLVTLVGELQPYGRQVRNKPGDFVLINRATQQPIAFLYSTKVDLSPKIGQEITIEGVERPNNHFAYPAFFVYSAK